MHSSAVTSRYSHSGAVREGMFAAVLLTGTCLGLFLSLFPFPLARSSPALEVVLGNVNCCKQRLPRRLRSCGLPLMFRGASMISNSTTPSLAKQKHF
jgi:hypothetical protein